LILKPDGKIKLQISSKYFGIERDILFDDKSQIHGRGNFYRVPLKKKVRVGYPYGYLVPKNPSEQEKMTLREVRVFDIASRSVQTVVMVDESQFRFTNHSSKPTLRMLQSGAIVALKKGTPGSEATEHYLTKKELKKYSVSIHFVRVQPLKKIKRFKTCTSISKFFQMHYL